MHDIDNEVNEMLITRLIVSKHMRLEKAPLSCSYLVFKESSMNFVKKSIHPTDKETQ